MDNKPCLVCSEVILTQGNQAILGSDKFSFMLKEYQIIEMCRECFAEAKDIYRHDLEDFDDWLDENDARSYDEADLINTAAMLTKGQGLDTLLLETNSELYYSNLDKYASRTTNFAVWFANKFEVNLESLIKEYERERTQSIPEHAE